MGRLFWFMGPPERLPQLFPYLAQGDLLLISGGGVCHLLRRGSFPEGMPDGVALYVLDLDLKLRGLDPEDLLDGVVVIDLAELVRLLRRFRVVTWS